jgi:hypothetical protein
MIFSQVKRNSTMHVPVDGLCAFFRLFHELLKFSVVFEPFSPQFLVPRKEREGQAAS